jgi:hypothetical protein
MDIKKLRSTSPIEGSPNVKKLLVVNKTFGKAGETNVHFEKEDEVKFESHSVMKGKRRAKKEAKLQKLIQKEELKKQDPFYKVFDLK